MTTTTTTEPITTSGWYEHTDGTAGCYAWRDGQIHLDRTATSLAAGVEADAARLDVERAIDRSDSHTEVVTLEYSDARAEALLAASDDSVDAGRVVEFWGTSEAGDEWRVHLRRATIA